MGIMDAANNLVEQGKAALDSNGDGKVEAKEVFDKIAEGAKDVAAEAAEKVDELKKSIDIDEDGKVSLEEVQLVAEDLADKAKDAVTNLGKKIVGEE